MNATTKPAVSSQTKSANEGGLTAVSVKPPRKVTYVFKATTSDNLSIPYVVAVDGKVLAAYAGRTARVSGKGGRLTVTVQQGQRVSLYLNSDAHPDFRKQPVYAVTPGERDVVVSITEKKGKHKDTDVPVLQANTAGAQGDAKKEDVYAAPLTGDIWMKVSHKYTADEVEPRLPNGTSSAVQKAVKSIYTGLSSSTLVINEPAKAERPARTLTVKFTDSNNPKDNISSYTLLADGLPRVHPGGYAALFTAALECKTPSITVSSCWRPMLGSIAHRAGLGLDVSVVGGTNMNRQELRRSLKVSSSSSKGNGDDKDNVTDAEVRAFSEYEQAIAQKKKADAELDAAAATLKSANKGGEAQRIMAAQERFAEAEKNAKLATDLRAKKRAVWDQQRDAGEPLQAKLFRASLLECSCVRQLFDPWFMEQNTKDSKQSEPNMQVTSNETLHAHHLHITVDDPKIL